MRSLVQFLLVHWVKNLYISDLACVVSLQVKVQANSQTHLPSQISLNLKTRAPKACREYLMPREFPAIQKKLQTHRFWLFHYLQSWSRIHSHATSWSRGRGGEGKRKERRGERRWEGRVVGEKRDNEKVCICMERGRERGEERGRGREEKWEGERRRGGRREISYKSSKARPHKLNIIYIYIMYICI